jgi:hypothetical protein
VFDRIWALSAVVVLMGASVGGSIAGHSASSAAMVGIGTVTTASGAAMPGAAVDLYAWPSDAVQSALKPGETVPTTLLATATTNKAGQYALQVSPAKLKAAAVELGYANLEIFSPVGGFWFFSYQTGTLPARPSAPVTVNLGGKKRPSCGLTPRHKPYFFTSYKFQRERSPAPAVVGQGYIVRQKPKTVGDTVNFEYDQGSSHMQISTLGVGISGHGLDAGYQSSGTHTSTATRMETYAPAHGNAWFRTDFKVGQFRGICYGPANDSNIPNQNQQHCPKTITDAQGAVHYVHKCFWLIKSIGWFGGTSTVVPKHSPRTPAKFCASHEADSGFGGDFGKAVQWSGGFEFGAADGVKGVTGNLKFNASAQTGYDQNDHMYFHFNHKGYLCGTNGSESTAALLVERSNKP